MSKALNCYQFHIADNLAEARTKTKLAEDSSSIENGDSKRKRGYVDNEFFANDVLLLL